VTIPLLDGVPRLADLAVDGRRVLVRADLNVPLRDGAVADDLRIAASLPTLRHLLEQGEAFIVCSHLGRPSQPGDPATSLAPVAARLGELLGRPVALAADVAGDDARSRAAALAPGEVRIVHLQVPERELY
jgi:phosphoglycerate kinase